MVAQGSRSQFAAAFESTYGTAPGSGFFLLPFASTGLSTRQGLLENELVGMGREPLAPQRDVVRSGGDTVIPVDVRNIGYWLKALLGAPTTAGSTNKTHTYTSGATALPSMAIEKGFTDIAQYEMFTGCVVNSMRFGLGVSGQLQATASIIAQGSTAPAGSSAAGTPTSLALTRFGQFNGSVKRDGSALGSIVAGEFTYSNNLDVIETIRSDGRIDGVDPGLVTVGGKLTARFADTTLLTQAINGTSCALELGWTIDANTSLLFTFHEVYLPRPNIEIPGPAGVQVEFDWVGARGTSPARCMTAVLKNQVTGY